MCRLMYRCLRLPFMLSKKAPLLKKYLPDAYSPVHRLWLDMIAAKGIPVTKIRDSMVKSVGGIVMKSEVANRIRANHQ